MKCYYVCCLQIFPFTPFIWGLYSLAVVLLFTVIKIVNYRLHVMYDTSLPVEEPELEDMGNHGESQDHVDGNHSRSGETLGDANDGECCRYLKHINYVLISSRVQTVCQKIQ